MGVKGGPPALAGWLHPAATKARPGCRPSAGGQGSQAERTRAIWLITETATVVGGMRTNAGPPFLLAVLANPGRVGGSRDRDSRVMGP